MDDHPDSGQPQDSGSESATSSDPTTTASETGGMSTGLKVGIGIGILIAALLLILIFTQLSGGSGGSAADETATAEAPVVVQPIAPTATAGIGSGDGGIIIVVPTPVAGEPSVTANTAVNIRSGPSTAFPVIGLMNEGETATAVGQNSAGDWWAILLPGTAGGVGWVSADLMTASNTENVPIVEAPIAPTPTVAPPIAITGWKGEYFDNRELRGSPVLVRDDPEINFNWGTGSPAADIPNDQFSARWTINRNAAAGVYVFTTWVDDGIRVWVDEQLIINGWAEGPARNYTAEVELAEGAHAFRIEYFENVGGAMISVNIGYKGVVPPAVTPEAPRAVINGPTQAEAGQEVTFNADGSSVSPGSHITRTEWDFGDGTSATGNPTSHVFTAQGVYNVLLTLTDDKGLTGSSSQQVRITSSAVATDVPTVVPTEEPTEEPTVPPIVPAPVAGIVAPAGAVVSEDVTFDGSSSVAATPIQSYQWDFGDGTVGEGAVVVHAYAAPGTYNATLTVVDGDGLTGTASVPIVIAAGEAAPLPESIESTPSP